MKIICNLAPVSVQLSITNHLLSWQVYQLKEDFEGFARLQKVLVRRDTETPAAKRGVVNYWILSPKQKRVTCWGEDLFKESVYNSKMPPQQDARYDKMFWQLVEPKLKANQNLRKAYGYTFYKYKKQPIKITDGLNTIILKPDTNFTVYKYGTRWSLRAMNKMGKLVDVDGLKDQLVNRLIKSSEELFIPQPSKFDQVKDATPQRDFSK